MMISDSSYDFSLCDTLMEPILTETGGTFEHMAYHFDGTLDETMRSLTKEGMQFIRYSPPKPLDGFAHISAYMQSNGDTNGVTRILLVERDLSTHKAWAFPTPQAFEIARERLQAIDGLLQVTDTVVRNPDIRVMGFRVRANKSIVIEIVWRRVPVFQHIVFGQPR
jgi:hypothetical protein